jgi:isopentenyl diphosphate isomerase/L-lactate dehydrogenase-like FMN-dependent dehydrogenase
MLGFQFSSPIAFGPFPHQGLAHKDQELESARAAEKLGMLYTLSCFSNSSIEEVAEASKAQMLFELDLRLPSQVIDDLLKRISWFPQFIGVVINAQYSSDRLTENEWKNDFELAPHLRLGNLEQYR